MLVTDEVRSYIGLSTKAEFACDAVESGAVDMVFHSTVAASDAPGRSSTLPMKPAARRWRRMRTCCSNWLLR